MKAVGIDLGGTFIKSGVVDEKGEIIKKKQFPTMAEKGEREIVISQIEEAINFCLEG
ncbi:MAG: ROK family protein, partial [Thermoplasmata archaeon]